MDYEDASEDIENDYERAANEEVAEDDLKEIEDLDKIDKKVSNKHSLEVRRAIEDHLDRNRLRKELDYLFDDEFASGDEEE